MGRTELGLHANEYTPMIHPELTDCIEKMRDQYLKRFKLVSYYYINSGLCEDFANDVTEKFPEADAIWPSEICDGGCPNHDWEYDGELRLVGQCSYDGHCVIQYVEGGKAYYFDAECPEGVEDVREIPFFTRQFKYEAAHAHSVQS